jgi:hypothetical protein
MYTLMGAQGLCHVHGGRHAWVIAWFMNTHPEIGRDV